MLFGVSQNAVLQCIKKEDVAFLGVILLDSTWKIGYLIVFHACLSFFSTQFEGIGYGKS